MFISVYNKNSLAKTKRQNTFISKNYCNNNSKKNENKIKLPKTLRH